VDQVLEAERQLRGLLGIPPEDGMRLVPIDAPTLAPFQPDWTGALHEALTLRPELVQARIELKARQLDIINTKNLLLPDVRFFSSYDINSVGTRLDGPSEANALRNLASAKFNNYGLGLRAEIPLGFRDAHAQTRQSRLNLARTYFALQDNERRAINQLVFQYRRLATTHELIRANRAQREAAAQQLEARFKEFLAGRGTLDILLEAQRFWADALREEYNAIAQYNIALAGFQFAKGTMLQHDNVVISEGPLPQCAQVRAVDHEKERSKALVFRERAKPVSTDCKTCPGLPEIPDDEAPSIPALMEGKKQALPVPDALPAGPDATRSARTARELPGPVVPKLPGRNANVTPAALPLDLSPFEPAKGKLTDKPAEKK
jgi:hypothetical protein